MDDDNKDKPPFPPSRRWEREGGQLGQKAGQNPPKEPNLSKPPWFREGQDGADGAQNPQVFVTPTSPPSPNVSRETRQHRSFPTPQMSNESPPSFRQATTPAPAAPPPAAPPSNLEHRMAALEQNYARTADDFKESSLAMVKALEILESRIGAQTGQPLGGMGEGELSKQLAAMRSELAQFKNRMDGLLPPPQGYQAQQVPPQSYQAKTESRNIYAPPPPQFTPSIQANRGQVHPWTPPRPAKIKRSTGRGFLSFLIAVAAFVFAWYAANSMNDMRDRVDPLGFQQEYMGDKNAQGERTLPKPKNALDYFRDAESLYHQYEQGKDKSVLAKALNYYQIAANEGMVAAIYRLGNFYEMGTGVAPDLNKARTFYTQAAHGGHVRAMHQLGMLYLEGRGVIYDIASASEWLLKAAGFGFADSMNQLGFVNEEGKLGARNIIHAYAWYSLAARLGHTSAAQQVPRLAISLSSRNKKEAEALVNSWRIREADPVVNGLIPTQPASSRLTLQE